MAVSDDGIHFTKTEDSPILADTLCEADKKDFRDPYIWRQNGEWNMILGSTKDHFAQALLYRSNDLKNWRFINTMAESLENWGLYVSALISLKLGENISCLFRRTG